MEDSTCTRRDSQSENSSGSICGVTTDHRTFPIFIFFLKKISNLGPGAMAQCSVIKNPGCSFQEARSDS